MNLTVSITNSTIEDLSEIFKLYRLATEFQKINQCSKYANEIGLEVHAGHGLNFLSSKILSKIKYIQEFNIGHFLVGESIFLGLKKTIKKFKTLIK